MVRCGTCGNNCCNGGNGCDNCDSAYALQHERWPDKKDWDAFKTIAGREQELVIGDVTYEMWQESDSNAALIRRQRHDIPRGKRNPENYMRPW